MNVSKTSIVVDRSYSGVEIQLIYFPASILLILTINIWYIVDNTTNNLLYLQHD